MRSNLEVGQTGLGIGLEEWCGRKGEFKDANVSTSNSGLKDGAHFSKMQKSEGEDVRRRKLMALLKIFEVGEAS